MLPHMSLLAAPMVTGPSYPELQGLASCHPGKVLRE